jgi:hypothetical protein
MSSGSDGSSSGSSSASLRVTLQQATCVLQRADHRQRVGRQLAHTRARNACTHPHIHTSTLSHLRQRVCRRLAQERLGLAEHEQRARDLASGGRPREGTRVATTASALFRFLARCRRRVGSAGRWQREQPRADEGAEAEEAANKQVARVARLRVCMGFRGCG